MDMDTVKVDLQKLQLLNDRITQTIEALDQVRASVHGIQHSMGASRQGFASELGMGQQGMGQGWQQGGLSHSNPQPGGFRPFAGMMQQPQQGFGPYGFQGQAQPGVNPFVPQGGISHSGYGQQIGMNPYAQQTAMSSFGQQMEPTWQRRVATTFPFAGYPVPPVTIY